MHILHKHGVQNKTELSLYCMTSNPSLLDNTSLKPPKLFFRLHRSPVGFCDPSVRSSQNADQQNFVHQNPVADALGTCGVL